MVASWLQPGAVEEGAAVGPRSGWGVRPVCSGEGLAEGAERWCRRRRRALVAAVRVQSVSIIGGSAGLRRRCVQSRDAGGGSSWCAYPICTGSEKFLLTTSPAR